jgi:hypothetical protein
MGLDETPNQDLLCWRGPAAIYPTRPYPMFFLRACKVQDKFNSSKLLLSSHIILAVQRWGISLSNCHSKKPSSDLWGFTCCKAHAGM